MPAEETTPPDRPEDRSASDDAVPTIEDAYEADAPPDPVVGEDDPELLSHALEPQTAVDETAEAVAAPPRVAASPAPRFADEEVAGDAEAIADEPESAGREAPPAVEVWFDRETSSRRIAVELKRIEAEVRELLEGRDTKRKRKLAGTRRWLELEEDIISWRYSDRFDEPTLTRLQRLIALRHYLFQRLRFLAGTRQTWNT